MDNQSTTQVQKFPADFLSYHQERSAHWDSVARKMDHWQSQGAYYQRRLTVVYSHLVPPGKRVLELGCGRGNLLATLEPSYGVGIDFSAEMIQRACQRYPHLTFLHCDVHEMTLKNEKFDFIILSDTINDLWDIQRVFEQVHHFCHSHTRIIANFYSRLWQVPLGIAQKLNLAVPLLFQNWLTVEDLDDLLKLTDFETIRSWREILFPYPVPVIEPIFNRYLVKLWPFKHLALTNFIVARPQMIPDVNTYPSVSIVIPARNEAGNIRNIFERVPQVGAATEIIFVEGNSSDDTYRTIEAEIASHPHISSKLLKQKGKGKGDALREGFAHATGDILMILDADLTVPPEDLPRFFNAIVSNKGEFINGIRLIYPMEDEAMQFLNFLGNKFFSLAFTWLLGQTVKDTLCGTKVLWKIDYQEIAANRGYFGDFDPFGDFDLLFGAAKLSHKIIDLPIRYRSRTYGSTNINRWKHGALLLRMVLFAASRLKFI